MSKSRRPKYGWDTSVFLAWIGQEECYPLDDIALVADEIDASRADLIMSAIVYSEILEAKHSKQQMKQFQMFLKRSNVIVVDVTIGMAQKAAEIRGKAAKAKEKRRLKTPDAIVIATALVYGADVLHSFDPHLVNLSGTAIVDGLKITHPHLITGQRALPGVVASGEDQSAPAGPPNAVRVLADRSFIIGFCPLIINGWNGPLHGIARFCARSAPPELMPVTTATQSFRAEESGPEPPLVRLSLVQRLARLPGKHPSTWAIAALLVLAVGLAFGQTIGFQFVNFDDDVGVYENPLVTRGFTWRGIAAVFSQRHVESWCPLTCVSHILDWQLYRDWAGGHHLTNVLLHAGSAVSAVSGVVADDGQALGKRDGRRLLRRASAARRIRGVGDGAKRCPGRALLHAGAGRVRAPARHPFSLASYVAVVAVFAVGLAAKPIVITLPFLFLLLDYWPLCRLRDIKPRSSIAPSVKPRSLIAPSVDPRSSIAPSVKPRSSIAPFCCRRDFCRDEVAIDDRGFVRARPGKAPALCAGGNFLRPYGLGASRLRGRPCRFPDAVASGQRPDLLPSYLGQSFYPIGLAVCYPHRGPELPVLTVLAALLVLLGVSLAVFLCRRRCPYLLVGWLWYGGMLAPVIGIVQFGNQSEADRFTYLAQIGLCIGAVWGLSDLCRRWSSGRWVCGVAAASVLTVLAAGAWRQASFWRNSEAMWTRTLACTVRNSVAHNDLGIVLAERGRLDAAIEHCRKSVEIQPDYVKARNNLGLALSMRGRVDEGMEQYLAALKLQPNFPEAHYNLANLLVAKGQLDAAIQHYRKALELRPTYAKAHCDLGIVLVTRNEPAEAEAHFRQALQYRPNLVEAHSNLALLLLRQGQWADAMTHYRQVLAIRPKDANAWNTVAWLLATCPEDRLRNGASGDPFCETGAQLGGDTPEILKSLAAAYAEAGMFSQALATAERAWRSPAGRTIGIWPTA